ncbi:GNAT family N-acetyltransferase [Halorarius litoreus]|uniref:GNAT family N-acetyltransferase n=1 Tax=Halorarius litoreus TaxID=2962676 RepID=UPI0020CD4451|nr:GNAT family N-acetyltransferase [Halorarius litoreus]
MNIRPAVSADGTRISDIARKSYESSYSLAPGTIDGILEEQFSKAALTDRIEASANLLFVAEADDGAGVDIQGFVDATAESEVTIGWLHVHPEARGQGIGTALVERIQEARGDRPLAARVLSSAVEGGEFFEQFGLRRSGSAHSTIGGEEHSVVLFTEPVRGEK